MKKTIFVFAFAALLSSKLCAQSVRSVVSGIIASGSGNSKITLYWVLPQNTDGSYIDSIKIYRSSRPISSWISIKDLSPIAELPQGSVSYVDNVTDKTEYFYAAVSVVKMGNKIQSELYYDEELDKIDSTGIGTELKIILPGVNATVQGAKAVFVPKKTSVKQKDYFKDRDYSDDSLREQPLPYIDFFGNEEIENKNNHKISRSAQQNVERLLKSSAAASDSKMLEPYYFEEDLISPESGDEYILFEILRSTFVQRKYEEAQSLLVKFLAQNRSEIVTQRADFYLGETYYFCGEYSLALSKFLSLQEVFPSLSHRWVQSTLNLYVQP